jgi:hypothetical protein
MTPKLSAPDTEPAAVLDQLSVTPCQCVPRLGTGYGALVISHIGLVLGPGISSPVKVNHSGQFDRRRMEDVMTDRNQKRRGTTPKRRRLASPEEYARRKKIRRLLENEVITDGVRRQIEDAWVRRYDYRFELDVDRYLYVLKLLRESATESELARDWYERLRTCKPKRPCRLMDCLPCKQRRKDQQFAAFWAFCKGKPRDKIFLVTILSQIVHGGGKTIEAAIRLERKRLQNHLRYALRTRKEFAGIAMCGMFEFDDANSELIKAGLKPHKWRVLEVLDRQPGSGGRPLLVHLHAVAYIPRKKQFRERLVRRLFPKAYQVKLGPLHDDKSVKKNLRAIASYIHKGVRYGQRETDRKSGPAKTRRPKETRVRRDQRVRRILRRSLSVSAKARRFTFGGS